MGSNHRLLACKAENGKRYAQVTESDHPSELRKPCPEMPSGAWNSLHGGSVPASGSRSSLLTPRFKSELGSGGRPTGVPPTGWPGLPYELRWTGGQAGGHLPNSGLAPAPRPGRERVLGSQHPDILRTREQLNRLTNRADGRPTPREHRPSRRVTGAMKDSADQVHTQ